MTRLGLSKQCLVLVVLSSCKHLVDQDYLCIIAEMGNHFQPEGPIPFCRPYGIGGLDQRQKWTEQQMWILPLHSRLVPTRMLLSILHPCKWEALLELRGTFQPGKNPRGECKTGQVRVCGLDLVLRARQRGLESHIQYYRVAQLDPWNCVYQVAERSILWDVLNELRTVPPEIKCTHSCL